MVSRAIRYGKILRILKQRFVALAKARQRKKELRRERVDACLMQTVASSAAKKPELLVVYGVDVDRPIYDFFCVARSEY